MQNPRIGSVRGVFWSIREWTLLVLLLLVVLARRLNAKGTTPFIKEIMIGRCLDYQQTHQAHLIPNGELKNCTQLWLKFKEGFSGKSHCSTSLQDFRPFVDSAYIPVPKDKAILWTGTSATVSDYASSGKRFYTISETLPGYMADGLHFCGQLPSPGMNYRSCPAWGKTCAKSSAEMSFWAAASLKFAESAEGVVHVMLNGTSGAAYRNDSMFTVYELPSLKRERVALLHAFLIHSFGQQKRETCDSGTMLKLRRDTESLGISYRCTENPSDVMYLLCVDDVDAWECKMISQLLGYISSAHKTISTVHSSLVAVCALLYMYS